LQKSAASILMKFETRAIKTGQEPDAATGATISPIYQTSTFTQEAVGIHKGYEYSRYGNPNRSALEQCLASLEEASFGLAFSSGLAAEHAVFSLLRPGDHVIVPLDMYGGTYRLITKILEPMNIRFSFADFSNPLDIQGSFEPATRMVWIETPTNPVLKIFDIAAIADLAGSKGALSVVDNTFATPYFQQPLLLGADIVVHSTTKYINGHSDVVGGSVLLNREDLYERLLMIQRTVGSVMSPFDCWLTLRGVKTLSLRMKQHEKNAFEIAGFLQHHPRVKEVLFPGLEGHPGHDLARRQMKGFGGLVSFRIDGGLEEANDFFRKLKIFQLADSLGGVESLANYSAVMTHSAFPEDLRRKIGVTEDLIRLSPGIEHADDLKEDLRQALS